MGAFSGGKYPFGQLSKSRGGGFRIRAFSKVWLDVQGSMAVLAAALNEQFSHAQTGAVATPCGSEAIVVYLPPLLGKGRIRVSYSKDGGERRNGRWDLWNPLEHIEFLQSKESSSPRVRVRKGLRGIVLRRCGLYVLEALNWRVFSEKDLCLCAGAEIIF